MDDDGLGEMVPLDHEAAGRLEGPTGRKDWRGSATRQALIETAESLFAEQGIAGV